VTFPTAALALLALGAPAPPAAGDPAAAPAKGRVALEALRAPGVSRALVDLVEERICVALGEASGADVVCPADVGAASALARQSALLGECSTDECMKRVDAIRAADRRVTGVLERAGGGLTLSLSLSDASGGGVHVSERIPEDLDALASRIPAIVKKLFP
jgi:hypothetical protein